MSFSDDFTLIPATDPPITPDENLDAALAGALGTSTVREITPDVAQPLGRSWRFDWERGQFERQGLSPAPVSGFDALGEWCAMAIHSARFAHPVFTDEFGMEKPNSLIGEFAIGEALVDWQRHLIDALLVHDRVSSVENVLLTWDPVGGVLSVDQLDVVTDEDERVTVSDITMRIGGASG